MCESFTFIQFVLPSTFLHRPFHLSLFFLFKYVFKPIEFTHYTVIFGNIMQNSTVVYDTSVYKNEHYFIMYTVMLRTQKKRIFFLNNYKRMLNVLQMTVYFHNVNSDYICYSKLYTSA